MDNDFVTVATYPDLTSAQYFRSLLAENGLHPFLPGEFAVGTQLPAFVFTRNGLQLRVPAGEAEEALHLLNEMAERGHAENEPFEPQATPAEEIPAAISSEYRRMTLLVAGALFVVPLAVWFLYCGIRWVSLLLR